MARPRISFLVILTQSLLLLLCLGGLAYTVMHKWALKTEAKRYAVIAGIDHATHNYLRGNYCFYEVQLFDFGPDDVGTVPQDGSLKPSGKRDGELPIYYFLVGRKGWPKWHQEIQQAYVDAYNDRMRLMFGHPNWFDQNGDRIPQADLRQNGDNTTNGR